MNATTPRNPQGDARPTALPSTMSRADFVGRFGGVFEHSPWVAEDTWNRGLGPDADCAEGLHRRMCAVLRSATPDQQRDVLLAHPDLAGRLALAGALTHESTAEQASAGLDQCSPEELTRFQTLNDAYKAKFGIPFIMAVKGRTRRDILAAFERRMLNDPAVEFTEALAQVERIARLRLNDLLPAPGESRRRSCDRG